MKTRKTKVLFALVLCLTLMLGGNTIALANGVSSEVKSVNSSEDAQLRAAYDEIVKYAKDHNIPLHLEYGVFVTEYNNTGYGNINDYKEAYYNLLKPMPNNEIRAMSNKGSPFAWQYNTGLTLPRTPNYSKYNLLEVCEPGDLVYEANGGFGLTGHMAMIEGKFYDEASGQYYIRVIEAIQNGVVRSILDDDRMDMQKSYIYRVTDSDENMRQKALEFEISQLGKPYWLDFAKHTSPDTKKWYCSELAWAAYKNQGIDIETKAFFNEPGVSPRDIVNSGMLTLIDVSK